MKKLIAKPVMLPALTSVRLGVGAIGSGPLFFWNAMKFAWMAVLGPILWLSQWLREFGHGELPRPEPTWLSAPGPH